MILAYKRKRLNIKYLGYLSITKYFEKSHVNVLMISDLNIHRGRFVSFVVKFLNNRMHLHFMMWRRPLYQPGTLKSHSTHFQRN